MLLLPDKSCMQRMGYIQCSVAAKKTVPKNSTTGRQLKEFGGGEGLIFTALGYIHSRQRPVA